MDVGNSVMLSQEDADYEAREVFTKLRPLCTQLMELHGGEAGTVSLVLGTLTLILKEVPAGGLQRCMDYILFPVLFLLDAAVHCRASPSSSESTCQSTQKKGAKPFFVADKVAEGVLSCLEVVLERCLVKNVNQMCMLLRKLTAAAMLSLDEASEEFRHGVVKCLKAFFLQLDPCDDVICRCKLSHIPDSLFIDSHGSLKVDFHMLPVKYKVTTELETFSLQKGDTCPMTFLRSEDMSAAIGHLLSLLLKVSQTEATRGGLGSGRLRVDALYTMRAIVLKVGAADSLAFFLPGVVSGLGKATRESWPGSHSPDVPAHIVGAAGVSGAVEQAVKGMAELLVLVLADALNTSCLEVTQLPQMDARSTCNQTASSAEEALKSLHSLSTKYSSQSNNAKEETPLLHVSHKVSEFAVGVPKNVSGPENINSDPSQEVRKDSKTHNLRVDRSLDWLKETATRVNGFLSATFPSLCAHPTPAVRRALAEGCGILLLTCSQTLQICVPLFLECLLALACDEWWHVASTAHSFLEYLVFSSSGGLELNKFKHSNVQFDENQFVGCCKMQEALVDLIHRLIDELPKTIAAANETLSVLCARKLAAAMYYLGPQELHSSVFHSSATTSHFLNVLTQCLGFTSAFTGPLEKAVFEGSELINKTLIYAEDSSKDLAIMPRGREKQSNVGRQITDLDLELQTKQLAGNIGEEVASEQLPRIPPWLFQSGKSKLYNILALIIRLAGVTSSVGCQSSASLKGFVEPLLATMQHAAVELGQEWLKKEDIFLQPLFQNGQLQRHAATAACVLNELVYGASGVWIHKLREIFTSANHHKDVKKESSAQHASSKDRTVDVREDASSSFEGYGFQYNIWQQACKAEQNSHILDLVTEIVHDYTVSDLWDLPLNLTDSLSEDIDVEVDLYHFLLDNAILQQVLVEGVGICAISVGKSFDDRGLLGFVLYPLLEKLGSPNDPVAHAATLTLRAICRHCGYESVKSLVTANADHIIDSLCRQLRHLTLHPHAPNLLAVILRQTGAAPDLLPLLKEPLQGMLLELEIPGRHQHPFFTAPILKAVHEIMKAARHEAAKVPEASLNQGYQSDIKENGCGGNNLSDHMDDVMHNVEEIQRTQCSIASIATSCLTSCAPLLASREQQTSLLTLDILEDGITALADTESTLKSEKVQVELLVETLQSSVHKYAQDMQKILESFEKETNKLLPAMHKVWPHLVLCLRQSWPSVIFKSLDVIALASDKCGGEFFARRFKTDALPSFISLLSGGYSRKSFGVGTGRSIQNVVTIDRNKKDLRQDMSSSAVSLKIQEAALKFISKVGERKRSAPALEAVIDPVAAWVVAIGCSNHSLKDLATDTLLALSRIDADLVWILVADIAYSAAQNIFQVSGATETYKSGLPHVSTILPAMTTDVDALFMQYAGRDCNIKTDQARACTVLGKLESTITEDISVV